MDTVNVKERITLPSKKEILLKLADLELIVPIEHFWESVSPAITDLAGRHLHEEELAKHLAFAVKRIPVDGALLRPLARENMVCVIFNIVSDPQQRVRVTEHFEKEMDY